VSANLVTDLASTRSAPGRAALLHEPAARLAHEPPRAPDPAAPREPRVVRLAVDGIEIDFYLADGPADGPVVVAIPPLWVPAQVMMTETLSYLSPVATGLTMDAPCVGRSGDPPDASPLYFVERYGSVVGAMTRIFLAAFDQLDIDVRRRPLVLLGHCSGAWVACDLVRIGLRPRRLVLSTVPPWDNDLIGMFGRGIVTDRGGGWWVYDLDGYQKLRPGVRVTQVDVDKANTRALRVRPLRHPPFLDPDVGSYGGCVGPEVRSLEACRTVLLHPEHDVLAYAERQRIAAELGAELIVLKGEAHDPTPESKPLWRNTIVRLTLEALVDELVGRSAHA
jgi:hypothetical protein